MPWNNDQYGNPYGGGQGYGNGHGSGPNAKDFAEKAFSAAGEALNKADFDKTTKVFGLFEVDDGMAQMISAAYNNVVGFGSQWITPRTYDFVRANAQRVGVKPGMVPKTAAIATVVVDVAMKTGKYVTDIAQGFTDQQQERVRVLRKIAPVLDDIKGKHALSAFMSISASENEVLYAHRKRMAKKDSIDNGGRYADLFLNALPSVAIGYVTQGRHMFSDHGADAASDMMRGVKLENIWLPTMLVNSFSAPLANRIKAAGQHKKEKKMQAYSALEMILALEEQMQKDPKASSFSTPGQHGESYPLEEYITRVLIQHQKDMAEISSDHTELRKALQEDLANIVTPIAESMKKGDLSPLALVRLVGERKIIKAKGRAIAKPEEIEAYINKNAGKTQTYVNVDPKEYYATASFNKEELKELLKKVDKDDKALIASWVPDSLLKQAGMKDEEIKQLRTVSVKDYERNLGEAFAGLVSHTDEQLKKEGFAESEIKQLRKAEETLKQGGLAAVHDLKTSPANDKGIERSLVNYAVSHIKGDKQRLGTLMSQGKEALASMTDIAANDEGGEKGEKTAPKKFTSRAKQQEREDAANDDAPEAANDTFKNRETRRRASSEDSERDLSA